MGTFGCPDPGTTISPAIIPTMTSTIAPTLSSAGPEDETTIFSTDASTTVSTTASPNTSEWINAGILVAIAVVGLIANTTVFIVVCFSRRFKNDFIFFVNLAVADFIACAALLVFAWYIVHPSERGYSELCALVAAFEWLIGWSTLSMASIAIKRDVFIQRTVVELRLLRNEGFRFTFGLVLWIAVTWVYPAVVVAVPFIVNDEVSCKVAVSLAGLCPMREDFGLCPIKEDSDRVYFQELLYVVLVIGVPMVIVLLCSCRSLYRVWRELVSRSGWNSRGDDADNRRRLLASNPYSPLADDKLRKVARVILASCTGFLVLFLPYLVSVIYRGTSQIVAKEFMVLMASSCCINPFIYAFTVGDFRRTLGSIFGCRWGRVAQPRFAYIQRRRDYEILRETDNVRSIVVVGPYDYDEDDDTIQVF